MGGGGRRNSLLETGEVGGGPQRRVLSPRLPLQGRGAGGRPRGPSVAVAGRGAGHRSSRRGGAEDRGCQQVGETPPALAGPGEAKTPGPQAGWKPPGAPRSRCQLCARCWGGSSPHCPAPRPGSASSVTGAVLAVRIRPQQAKGGRRGRGARRWGKRAWKAKGEQSRRHRVQPAGSAQPGRAETRGCLAAPAAGRSRSLSPSSALAPGLNIKRGQG